MTLVKFHFKSSVSRLFHVNIIFGNSYCESCQSEDSQRFCAQ